jgi:GMP reductase
MGINPPDFDKFCRVKALAGDTIQNVCVDVANGYTKAFVSFIHKLRAAYPDITIMAGNVVTGEMTEELILDGVDIVKVGIGPGSVCTTRRMSGVGYPQLSAIIECADAAHGLRGLICADGGCTSPGDLAKAFGAGADFVMLGGMLAGHDECGSEVVEQDGVRKMRFYGMSSREAMKKYAGGVAEYRAAEGKDVLIDYRGPVENTLQDILGGVRSACTYVGARKLKELSKCTTFIRVTQQLNEVFGQS